MTREECERLIGARVLLRIRDVDPTHPKAHETVIKEVSPKGYVNSSLGWWHHDALALVEAL